MKKIYVVMAVLATAVLASCQQEKSFDELTPLGENGIAFSLKGISTRSTEGNPTAVKGITIPLESQVNGESFYLEETIEELNPSPATRGVPAYTFNVGTLYPNMGVYTADLGDATFEKMDMYDHKGTPSDPNAPTAAEPDDEVGDGWRYHHNYASDPWPENEEEPVDFYLRMPATATEISALAYSEEEKSIEFDYASPLIGKKQQDILFAQTSLSKKQHNTYLPNGAPVLMYHALTGVKFRTGNDNTGTTKTIITKVRFKGLKDQGHCKIIPATGVVEWPNPVYNGKVFEQEFSNPAYSETSDNTVDLDNDYFNGTSITTAAADMNLNEDDGSLTFWFIPQEIGSNVKLEVTFCVKTPDTSGSTGGGMITHTIDFGEILNKERENNVIWKAGQLRTYTLEPKEVDVEIFDTMSGMTKSGLHVTNTGNVDEYVRMLLLGNWYGWETQADKDAGKEPKILVGYKYKDEAEAAEKNGNVNDMVDAWYRGGYDHDGDGVYEDPYGHFDPTFLLGELGDRDGDKDDWADASGGYYFTSKLGPGEGTDSGTKSLFESYELASVPTIWLPSGDTRVQAVGVHLVMEVAIQAIAVPKDSDGNDVWWLQAWYDATNIAKLNPSHADNAKYLEKYEAGEYSEE